jgi:hypothetical protein
MPLTDYCTYSEVRATLGVSTTELTDATLSSTMYVTLVTLALEDVHTNIPTEFAAVSALSSGSRTAQQARFYDLVKLYAPYALAKELLVSLPLFSVQRLTDGKAEFQRQSDIFQDTKDGIDSALVALRYRLAAAYETLHAGSINTRTRLITSLSAGLATDPVTNT